MTITLERERRREVPRQCAWCERFGVAGRWIDGRRDNDSVVAHSKTMTHTICDDCIARLRREGKSA